MDIYETAVLRKVVEDLDQPSSFLLDTYFREQQTEQSEEIHFDIDLSKPRLTPFVSPLKAGIVVQSEGHKTKSFRPAYAKDKRHFKPDTPLKRAIGEQIGGNLNPMQRRMLHLRSEMEDQVEMLTRREEVMASEALRLGQVTVAGDGYPTVVVDFERHADLTVALLAGSQWDNAGVNPVDNLEDWCVTVQDHSGGVARVVTMDPKAWKLFRANEDVQKLLETRRGSMSNMELGPQSRGQGNNKARFVGMLGDLEIWVYQENYVDAAGATQKVMPDNTVIVGDPNAVEGVRAYGAIQDEKANYMAERYFVKSWLEEDPAIRWLLLQAAPLVVPYRPNGVLCATVA